MKTYMIFSIFLFILLVGALGTNIYTQHQLTETKKQHSQDLDNLQNQIVHQKEAKNAIRDLWENQAASNDKLILAQDQVKQKTDAYQAEIKKSIRFINSTPQLLPGANEISLTAAEKDLQNAQTSLETLTRENINLKADNKNKVDSIYLNLGEDQSNRANPRDGTR